MVSDINNTPKALRLHIGVFGATNAGKSTLINAVSGQDIALTSPVAGTTTDPVFKPMELLPLGPVVFIDTAGLDDNTELGSLRMKKSMEQLKSCDAVLYVISSEAEDIPGQLEHVKAIAKNNIPILIIINQFSGKKINIRENYQVIAVDLQSKSDTQRLKGAIIDLLKDKEDEPVLTANLVKSGDVVILVAPQDIQAPKGRLILPEVQTIRDLLDNGCMAMTTTAGNLEAALSSLNKSPDLVITDSQIFKEVDAILPKDVPLTSFSMLMAKIKGDINGFINGAKAIDALNDGDRVAVLESCSHHALADDIARIKLPKLLAKYTGKRLEIDVLSGQSINEDIKKYKIAIHCGGCMVNRRAMLAKQNMFENMGVPMTNFGVAIAYMNGILGRVCY